MKRPLRSIYGQYVATVDDFRLIASKGLITGQWGNQLALEDNYNVGHWDDFVGAALLGTWSTFHGTDTEATSFAIAAGLSGVIEGTTGQTSTTMAGSGIQINGQLNFQAQGAAGTGSTNNLEFTARVQLSSIAGVAIFVGLTSQATALQMPLQGSGSGNGITVTNNNAVGFLYDTAMSTTDWWCVGASGGVAATALDCGSGPTAATWDQFQISIDQLGNANFFRTSGGSVLGDPVQQPAASAVTMAGSVGVTTPLCPVIAVFNRVAAQKNVLADYLGATMNRI